MKEELRELYLEYKNALEENAVWTHESTNGFIEWLLTGKF